MLLEVIGAEPIIIIIIKMCNTNGYRPAYVCKNQILLLSVHCGDENANVLVNITHIIIL